MKTDWTSIVKDRQGKISAMRVGFLFSLLCVMLNWSWVNYNNKTSFAPIPDNAITLIIGLAGAKVVQRFSEKIPNDTSTPVEKI